MPLTDKLQPGTDDALILAVVPLELRQMTAAGVYALGKPAHVVFDVTCLLDKAESDARL